MVYVATLFDPAKDGRPLYSAIYRDKERSLKLISLFQPKTGRKLYDIHQDLKMLGELITTEDEVHLNDYKQHLIGLNIQHGNNIVYDHPVSPNTLESNKFKSELARMIGHMKKEGKSNWLKIRGDASPVYRYLQQRGTFFNKELKYSTWSLDTYSGRSRTSGFNVQGLEDNTPLVNRNGDMLYLHFDFVSADLRAAALLSGDQKLEDSFINSDPYTYMADNINIGVTTDKLTRNEAKIALLKSLNSMNVDSPALQFYTGLRDWVKQCKEIAKHDTLKSILGRPFSIGNDRTILSAFNASIQGSVAHAMQACLRNVWELYPDNILAENHDSLVLTAANINDAKSIIMDVAGIMTHPFLGILENDPIFPIVVSCGKGYKNWKKLKRYGYESPAKSQ